jgi:hypothetical protein
MSTALLRVAIISWPSLSKASLLGFAPPRSEGVVHFRTVSKRRALQKRASGKFKTVSECVQSQNNETKRLTVGESKAPFFWASGQCWAPVVCQISSHCADPSEQKG